MSVFVTQNKPSFRASPRFSLCSRTLGRKQRDLPVSTLCLGLQEDKSKGRASSEVLPVCPVTPVQDTGSRQPYPTLPGDAGNATGCPKNGHTHAAGKHRQGSWIASWITSYWRGSLVPKAKNYRIWPARLRGRTTTQDSKGTGGCTSL